MSNLFLNLQSGQKLRILPFDENSIYDSTIMYHCNDLKKFFVYQDINFIDINHRDKVYRVIRYHLPIEYNDEIYFIKIGRKIKNKIDEIVKSSNLKINDFLTNEIILNISITETTYGLQVFPNYDLSNISIKMNNNWDNFFDSPQYNIVKKLYDSYINNLLLERNPNIITYLDYNNILKPQYNYLLRNKKINDIRSRKTNTTKLKLWNQVGKIICDASVDNERIDDIGYHKVDEKSEEVHQFMVDGYLFEIKLVDDV